MLHRVPNIFICIVQFIRKLILAGGKLRERLVLLLDKGEPRPKLFQSKIREALFTRRWRKLVLLPASQGEIAGQVPRSPEHSAVLRLQGSRRAQTV